jgi:mycothiol synthase
MVDMPPSLPPGLTARPLVPADARATAALLAASEQHFVGESFMDEADVIGQWSTAGVDLGVDSLGVVEGEELVGGCLVDDRRQVVVDVHPAHLGRGIGTFLAHRAEERAVDRGHAYVEQETAVADTAAATLLTARGYEPTHRVWVLRMDPGMPLARHTLPEDVTIGSFVPDDARAVHAVIEDAFAEWEDRLPRSYDDWRATVVDREGADPGFFRIARAGGEVVGVATVHDSGGTTWVPQLAVRADRRGQGIAQELLAEAFDAGRRRGCATGELATSGLTGALGLYRRLGMRVVAEFQTWRIDLSTWGRPQP